VKKEKIFGYVPYISIILMALVFGGCTSTTVAPDLLQQSHYKTHVVNKSAVVTSPVNKGIDRSEKVEESIKESLDIALNSANIFNKSSNEHYTIVATTALFSQSPMSFGKFGNKLNVNYKVYNENMKLIMNESIFTIGESDKWFFSGQKRAERARAVNIAKNVNQFMMKLKVKLK